MAVARLHAKLFESAAHNLDCQIRSHFVAQGLRAGYLKDVDEDLRCLDTADFRDQVKYMTRFVDGGFNVGGRFRFVKGLLARVLRPFTHHEAEVNRMTLERLEELYNHLTYLTSTCQSMYDSVQRDLVAQADALRAEFSARTRLREPAGEEPRPIAAGARIALGTLREKMSGYLHFDPTGEDAPPLDRLPVRPGTAAEILVANVLESFPAAEVRDRLLPYWASLLRPGGRMTVTADDIEAAGDRFRDGQIDLAELTSVLFGRGEGGSVRRSAYTPESLGQYLRGAGLTDVSVTDRRQRPESLAFGFELAAFRPAA